MDSRQTATLFYYPGAISLPVHIALLEAGLPHKLRKVELMQGEHLAPEFELLGPLKRVPFLETDNGLGLSQVPAILRYIAHHSSLSELLPIEGMGGVLTEQWLAFLASELHPPFGLFLRPGRFHFPTSTDEVVRAAALSRFREAMQLANGMLGGDGWCVGGRFSFCDVYLTTFLLWAKRIRLESAPLDGLEDLARRVAARPSFGEALKREGIGEQLSLLTASCSMS